MALKSTDKTQGKQEKNYNLKDFFKHLSVTFNVRKKYFFKYIVCMTAELPHDTVK